jgi:hypothetical protein
MIGLARRATRLAAILALAAGMTVTRAARADAYQAMLTRAIAAKERALDVNEPARWQEALLLFQQAVALRATPEAEYELAGAAERLAFDDLALEAYQAALDLGLVGPTRDKAARFVAEHAAGMARLELHGAPGTRIAVAGTGRGQLPLLRPIVVFAGHVELEVANGESRQTRVLELRPGELRVLEVSAESAATTAPPATAAPALGGSATAPSPATEQPGDGSAAPGWALVIGGGALVVGGAVLVPLAGSQLRAARAKIASDCAVPPASDGCAEARPGLESAAQSAVNRSASWKSVRTISWIGVAVGTVSVAGGVALLASRRSGGSARAARATSRFVPDVVLTPGRGELVWTGAWP